MPESTENANVTSATTPAVVVADDTIVRQLMNMGFSENGCRRAAIATNNIDADVAMNWVFEHVEDPDFNNPIVESSSASTSGSNENAPPSIEMIEMITAMGYNNIQANAALKATDNNLERAVDWIFSHMDNMDEAIALVNNEVPSSSNVSNNDNISCDDGEGKYELISIVSHIGSSTDHGHYICHIKVDGLWALYNDEKVI
jgi:ubiquitin carboxyl-terminal hydrolase 5/13